MRKLIIVAALVTAALTGTAGCADNSEPTTPPSGEQSQAGAGDQTKEVCVEAIKVSKDGADTLDAKSREAVKAFTSNDTAKVEQLGKDVTQLSDDWKATLIELSAKKIDADVKSALTNGISVVTSVSDTSKPATADVIRTKLQVFQTQLTSACDKS